MSNKLKPCPFCGGEAIVVKTESCGRYIGCWDCGGRTEEFETDYTGSARDKAIAAWNRRAEQENEPLTLDELKQMEGEPVRIVTLDGTDEPRWEIVVSAGKCGVDLICVLNGVETRDYADFDLYGDTWLAYRNKQKEEHYEAD